MGVEHAGRMELTEVQSGLAGAVANVDAGPAVEERGDDVSFPGIRGPVQKTHALKDARVQKHYKKNPENAFLESANNCHNMMMLSVC